MWKIRFTKQAEKHKTYLRNDGLENKAKFLLRVLLNDPFRTPPPCEKLIGNLQGFYSHRINHKHRLVYKVLCEEHIIVVYSMWLHY